MKVSELLGERYKDRVAEIESQNLMVRGGYIKQVGNGIYSLMPPARRIHNKIEVILRQEMDRIGRLPAAGKASARSFCALRTGVARIWCLA